MDQSRDLSGRELYRLTQLYTPPAFVKNATTAALCGDAELPAHLYADPRHKLYPMHTPAATWTSFAFFMDKKAELKPDDAKLIADQLDQMIAVHGIYDETQALLKKMAAAQPTGEEQLPDEDFALIVKTADGAKERRYPMRNNKEVRAAAEYVMKWRDSMPYQVRRGMADRVLQKAAQMGVSLGEQAGDIEKQAGYGSGTSAEAAECLLNRVQASRRGPGALSPVQREMLGLAQTIAVKSAQLHEPGARCKTAEIIDAFDRAHGLVETIAAGGLPRVEDVLFGVTQEKMAGVIAGHCSTVTGNIYKLAAIEQLKLRDVTASLGTEYSDAFTSDGVHVNSEKAAAVIGTMPRGDAAVFDELMSRVGLAPIAKEASSFALGASHEYLLAMAERLNTP